MLERYLSGTGTQGSQEVTEKKEEQRTENDDYCNVTATRKNGSVAYA